MTLLNVSPWLLATMLTVILGASLRLKLIIVTIVLSLNAFRTARTTAVVTRIVRVDEFLAS